MLHHRDRTVSGLIRLAQLLLRVAWLEDHTMTRWKYRYRAAGRDAAPNSSSALQIFPSLRSIGRGGPFAEEYLANDWELPIPDRPFGGRKIGWDGDKFVLFPEPPFGRAGTPL